MVTMMRLYLTSLVTLSCVARIATFQANFADTRGKAPLDLVLLSSEAPRDAGGRTKLPPVIQQIADERAEFQINLGRAMDTLRTDMQEILKKQLDFSIYHKDITVIDPSGVQSTGLKSYKSAFTFMQTFVKFWFSPLSRVQYRMVYDFCRSSIRISWNVVLVPKVPLGRPFHVDGISYYQLDADSGKIIEHKIERLVMNNRSVEPPYGILSLLQQDEFGRQGVPAGVLGSGTEPAGAFR